MKNKISASIIVCILIVITISPTTIGIDLSTKQIIKSEGIKEIFTEPFFDIYINTLMKVAHKPSIAACIIHNDIVVWSKGYGYYDLESQKPTNEDILYLQASVSKTVTATALMQLYEQGLFDLDDDINDYLPFELRNPNYPDEPITIKMVLSYFLIQVILSFILLKSFNVIFNNLGISLFIRISWLFWMCILILITRLFVFLSLNGFNPKRKEFLIPKKEINLRFYIWEIFFAVIYIVMGIIILFEIASGELTTSPRIFILTIVTILSLLSLGGVKSLKLVIKKNKRALKTLLIITSLMLSLVISFFVLYDSHLDFRFIYSSLSRNMFNFLFLPINIEIIYELFHFFSQLKN